MHLILKNYLQELSESFSYEQYQESKLFEFFCNYCVVSKQFFGRFDPKDVTTAEDDASIDGIAFIIDGDLITTKDDAEETFKSHKMNLSVDLIFVQAKSGEQFKKNEISNYQVGLLDFLSLEPKFPNGALNIESLEIFKIVLNNSKKIKNKLPNIYCYYCTSGIYKEEREIKAAFDTMEREIKNTDYFKNVSVVPVGRSEIMKFYRSISEKNEAKLKLVDFFSMPVMPGIPQSYVGIVNAKHFVSELLIDSDENIKQSVFEENIRAFLGEDNDVNSQIQATVMDDEKKKIELLIRIK